MSISSNGQQPYKTGKGLNSKKGLELRKQQNAQRTEESKTSDIQSASTTETKEKKGFLQKVSQFCKNLGNLFYSLAHRNSTSEFTALNPGPTQKPETANTSQTQASKSLNTETNGPPDTIETIESSLSSINPSPEQDFKESMTTLNELKDIRKRINTLKGGDAKQIHDLKTTLNAKIETLCTTISSHIDTQLNDIPTDTTDLSKMASTKEKLAITLTQLNSFQATTNSIDAKSTKSMLTRLNDKMKAQEKDLSSRLSKLNSTVIDAIESSKIDSTSLTSLSDANTQLFELQTSLKDFDFNTPELRAAQQTLKGKIDTTTQLFQDKVIDQLNNINSQNISSANISLQELSTLQQTISGFGKSNPDLATTSFIQEDLTSKIDQKAHDITTTITNTLTDLSGDPSDPLISEGKTISTQPFTEMTQIWTDKATATIQEFSKLQGQLKKMDKFEEISGGDISTLKQEFEHIQNKPLSLSDKQHQLESKLEDMGLAIKHKFQEATREQIKSTQSQVQRTIHTYRSREKGETDLQKELIQTASHFKDQLDHIDSKLNKTALQNSPGSPEGGWPEDTLTEVLDLYKEKEFLAYTTLTDTNYDTTNGKLNGPQRDKDQLESLILEKLNNNSKAKAYFDKHVGNILSGVSKSVENKNKALVFQSFANDSFMANVKVIDTYSQALETSFDTLSSTNDGSALTQLDQLSALHQMSTNFSDSSTGYLLGHESDLTLTQDKHMAALNEVILHSQQSEFGTNFEKDTASYLLDRLEHKGVIDGSGSIQSAPKFANFKYITEKEGNPDFRQGTILGKKGKHVDSFEKIQSQLNSKLGDMIRSGKPITKETLQTAIHQCTTDYQQAQLDTFSPDFKKTLSQYIAKRLDHKNITDQTGRIVTEKDITSSLESFSLTSKKDPDFLKHFGKGGTYEAQFNKLAKQLDAKAKNKVKSAQLSQGQSTSTSNTIAAGKTMGNSLELSDDASLKVRTLVNKLQNSTIQDKKEIWESIKDTLSNIRDASEENDASSGSEINESTTGLSQQALDAKDTLENAVETVQTILDAVEQTQDMVHQIEKALSQSNSDLDSVEGSANNQELLSKLSTFLDKIESSKDTIAATLNTTVDMVTDQIPYFNKIKASYHLIKGAAQLGLSVAQMDSSSKKLLEPNLSDEEKIDAFADFVLSKDARDEASITLVCNALNFASSEVNVGSMLKAIYDAAKIKGTTDKDELKDRIQKVVTLSENYKNVATTDKTVAADTFSSQMLQPKEKEGQTLAYTTGLMLQQIADHNPSVTDLSSSILRSILVN